MSDTASASRKAGPPKLRLSLSLPPTLLARLETERQELSRQRGIEVSLGEVARAAIRRGTDNAVNW